MAIKPDKTRENPIKQQLDHQIVGVERAASDVRRRLPVMIYQGGQAILIQAAELLTARGFQNFQDHNDAMGGGTPQIALSHNRATLLHIPPQDGPVVLIDRLPHMDSALIQSLGDPADDLTTPLRGPFQPTEQKSGMLHDAALKLCKIARLLPTALVSVPWSVTENKDRAEKRGILSVPAADILAFDQRESSALQLVSTARLPLAGAAKTVLTAFRPDDGGTEHFSLTIGDPNRHDPVLCRIHSECFTGDLLGSLKCDCGQQLQGAIDHMDKAGGGVLLYLAQEGRGIGLINKLRAYQLQDQGFDTVEANERLGFHADERIFAPAARMLTLLGFAKVRLLTNNPLKVKGLRACGITVTARVAHHFPSNPHNDHYLRTKQIRSGHIFESCKNE